MKLPHYQLMADFGHNYVWHVYCRRNVSMLFRHSKRLRYAECDSNASCGSFGNTFRVPLLRSVGEQGIEP